MEKSSVEPQDTLQIELEPQEQPTFPKFITETALTLMEGDQSDWPQSLKDLYKSGKDLEAWLTKYKPIFNEPPVEYPDLSLISEEDEATRKKLIEEYEEKKDTQKLLAQYLPKMEKDYQKTMEYLEEGLIDLKRRKDRKKKGNGNRFKKALQEAA